jgi:hypothetical protein
VRGAAAAGCVALAVLAGCAAPVPDRPPLLPAEQGLDVGGTGLEIGFGRTEGSTIDAVAYLLGGPPDSRGPAPGCPGRVARWAADGLTLYFTDGDFDGWAWRGADGGLRSAGRVCAAA